MERKEPRSTNETQSQDLAEEEKYLGESMSSGKPSPVTVIHQQDHIVDSRQAVVIPKLVKISTFVSDGVIVPNINPNTMDVQTALKVPKTPRLFQSYASRSNM